jgi:hypothetical protein
VPHHVRKHVSPVLTEHEYWAIILPCCFTTILHFMPHQSRYSKYRSNTYSPSNLHITRIEEDWRNSLFFISLTLFKFVTCVNFPSFFLSFFCSFIHMCIYCLGHLSTLPPSPPFPPPPTQFQAGPILPLSLILLKKRHKHNKEDRAFLLVELRIAIQRDFYYCFRVPMCYDPC